VRLPLIRRQSLPTAAGGLVAAGAAVAATVALLSGGHNAAGRDTAPGGALAALSGANAAGSASTASATTSAAHGAPAAGGTAEGTAAEALNGRVVPVGGESAGGEPAGTAPTEPGLAGATTTHLVVPDVIASVPGGLTQADLGRLKQLGGVRAVLAIDGARITVNGVRLTVLAAPAAALRPWTPPTTAANQRVWSAFQAGDLITSAQAATAAHLVSGRDYPVAAAVSARITDGGAALLGVAGVDGVVNQAVGRKLGLLRNVAVLVNAPAADMTKLVSQVKAALGASARVVGLAPASVSTSLPVDSAPPTGRPADYLQLFQESAARYCPGLSWTVLAAIGQIESADGQNMGPSTAGALGPMQFLPSTWATWGIDGFGDTGAPDIMNPFDAVPSAARLLCADGATSGGAGLRQAIFDYNHATWYVNEVLTLAAEYAREY
jgi:Transglycosylase SLT domain